MAILGKIQKQAGLTLGFIGVAMLLFLLGGIFSNRNSSIFSSLKNVVGTINGEDISIKDFVKKLNQNSNYLKQRGNDSYTDAVNLTWNNFKKEKVLIQEAEKIGLSISENQEWEALTKNPFVAQNPRFLENGQLNLEKFRTELGQYKQSDPNLYNQWIALSKELKHLELEKLYNDLVSYGMYSTRKEAELVNRFENERINLKYVMLPYIVGDSISISDEEINNYIKEHSKQFERDASTSLQYILFEITPSEEDIQETLKELKSLLDNRVERNAITNSDEVVLGFKETREDSTFINLESDESFNPNYRKQSELTPEEQSFIQKASIGDVSEPIKIGDNYEIIKLLEKRPVPDSINVSHILIAYAGNNRGLKDITRDKARSKQLADSLMIAIRNGSDFNRLTTQFSDDPGSKFKNGSYGWIKMGSFNNPPFENFFAFNPKGKIGIVETSFGYHVVKSGGQKSFQTRYKIANLVKHISPSSKTGNQIHTNAYQFLKQNKTIEEFNNAASDQNLSPQRVEGIKEMDSRIQGLGDQRKIVEWTFEKETKVGDSKLSDLENGYVIVLLTERYEKGLAVADEARLEVEPILRQNKKAEKIIHNLKTYKTLDEIASTNNQIVREADFVTFSNPILSGVGNEPSIIGAAFGLALNKTSKPLIGENGVFIIEVIKKETDTTQTSIQSEKRNKILKGLKDRTSQALTKLVDNAKIKDNRAKFY